MFDGYDERSLIENTLNREAKQSYGPKDLPKLTANAVYAHIYLTLVTFALVHAYRTYAHSESDAEASLWPAESPIEQPRVHRNMTMGAGIAIGTAWWRRQLAMVNADKVIVFLGESYGIFDIKEMMILADMRIRTEPGEVVRVLQKWGCI